MTEVWIWVGVGLLVGVVMHWVLMHYVIAALKGDVAARNSEDAVETVSKSEVNNKEKQS